MKFPLCLGICVALTLLAARGFAQQQPNKPPKPAKRTADSARTPSGKDSPRHQQFLAQAKAGKCGVLFLGDSITDHWPRWSKDSWATFAKYQPLDFGIGGEHTENMLWRIENGELDGIRPKVVVLLAGTNNLGHYNDQPEWIAGGVKAIIDSIHKKLPQTKVLLVGILPRSTKPAPIRAKVEQTNAILKTYDNGSTIRFLDFGAKFIDANEEIPKDLMPDGLHPVGKGYWIWADAMQPMLDEMMR